MSPVSVTTDIDAGEDDLLVSVSDELARLAQHVIQFPTSFSSPGEGDDAKGAKGIAAILDLQVGSRGVVATGALDLEIGARDELGMEDDRLGQFTGAGDEGGKGHLVLVADDHVHAGNLLDSLEPRLGVAAGHNHKGLGQTPEHLADDVPAPRLTWRGNRASIHHHEIGRQAPLDDRVPPLTEGPGQNRSLRLIEPTTQSRKRCSGARRN